MGMAWSGGGSAFRGRTHPPPCAYVGTCALCPSRRVPSPFVPWCPLWILPLSTYPCRKEEAFFCIRQSISASSFCTFICWHHLVAPGKDCWSFPFCPTSSGNSTNRRENNFSVQTPFGFCLNVKNNVSIFISIRCYFSK